MRRCRSSAQCCQGTDSRYDSPAVGTRPGSRAAACSFKNREDDIGEAMAAVKRVMCAKQKVGGSTPESGLGHSASSPSLRRAIHELEAQHEAEQQRSISREDMPWTHGQMMGRSKSSPGEEMPCERGLKTAMTSGNLLLLQNAIENATAAGVPVALIDEARKTLQFESRLQAAMSEADLSEVRKVVGELRRGSESTFAAFPHEPPFAMHQSLQYWSEMRQDWVNCRVVDTSVDDKILINLKKKADHWYSLREQKEKFRSPDADASIAARYVRLDTANALLDKADALQSALRSEDVALIDAAVACARREKSLLGLIARAEPFVKESMRRRSVDEAEPALASSDAAVSWQSTKKHIRRALRAKADRVWAQTAERGPDCQEWELAVGRLRQLEEDFDSTDLNTLELTIDKLGQDGFDVAVVDEARRALSALGAEIDGLQAAIDSGDIEKLRAALKSSRTDYWPDLLIWKARAVLEMATAFDAAMQSQDPESLESTLTQLELDTSGSAFVKRACGVVRATGALLAAMRSKDMEAIERAIGDALCDGVPRALVNQARQSLVQDRFEKKRREEARLMQARVFAAMRDGDIDTLRAMLEKVDDYSLSEALIRKARATLEITSTIDAAIKSEDWALLDNILAKAECESIDNSLVQRAHCITSANKALQVAIQCGDVDTIEQAIAAAHVDGVSATLVAQARQKVAELNERREAQKQRDNFLLHLDILTQSHDTMAMRAAIDEGVGLGFQHELDVLRNALEEELNHMKARALEFRREQEKLATEFKTAKEVQDLGGAILVAQWRAAVSAVSEPFVFSEEHECARRRKGL